MNESFLSSPIVPVSKFCDFRATVDVLRLDLLHPVVSGNKWFKLKDYLAEARQEQKTVLTYGGAFSNHIVATAAAANEQGLQSIGIIRGEKPTQLSHTLQQAMNYGMRIFFTTREAYRSKTIPEAVFSSSKAENLYIIPEGGYGEKGAAGAKDILLKNETTSYTHILSAVGTGTTMAGLVLAAKSSQKVLGISALKNNRSLEHEIKDLLPKEKRERFLLFHDYHFGGYAKQSKELFQFMNQFYAVSNIPTDFVYTGKAFFAAFDLISKNYFSKSDRLLLVHTGGLQGNRSLPKGSLIFG